MGRGKSQETQDFEAGLIRVARDLLRHVNTFTVRQLYYQCVVAGVVDKTEAGYRKVQQKSVDMREDGRLRDHHFSDTGRTVLSPLEYSSPQEALENLAEYYAESPWKEERVEIWLEKEALAEIVWSVAHKYHVTVRVMRGYGSRSAVYRAYNEIQDRKCKTIIYQLCDFDASGQGAGQDVVDKMYELAKQYGGDASKFAFYDLGVTQEQIRDWQLPTRPAKESDSRQVAFGHLEACELDAIPPAKFKEMIKECIEDHLPENELLIHEAEVETTRNVLRGLWATS